MVVPATPHDAKGLLLAAIEDPDPVIFLEPIRLYRAVKEEVPDGPYTVPIGPARVERTGTDLTLVGWGAMLREVRLAADQLGGEGLVGRGDRPAHPGPARRGLCWSRSAEKTGRVVVVHEAPRTAGIGAEVAALIQERALYSLQAPVLRVTGWDTVFPLKRTEHVYLPGRGTDRDSGATDPGGLILAYEFRLPDIGEGLTEAEVVRWLVEVGSDVSLDQPLVEVETDKAVVEIPSPRKGVVLHHGAPVGSVLEVGAVLAVIGEAGETWGESDAHTPAEQPLVTELDEIAPPSARRSWAASPRRRKCWARRPLRSRGGPRRSRWFGSWLENWGSIWPQSPAAGRGEG